MQDDGTHWGRSIAGNRVSESSFFFLRFPSRAILEAMDLDPHTLQLILHRIKQQMRCPQCGKEVPVDFTSVRVVGDNAMLLQLKCDTCNAYIVLHASLQGAVKFSSEPFQPDATRNVSSSLRLSEQEVQTLHAALEESDGSFQKLFQKYGVGEAQRTDIA